MDGVGAKGEAAADELLVSSLVERLEKHKGMQTILEQKGQLRRGKDKEFEIKVEEEREWKEFMVHLRKQAMREGAPAAVMDLYAILKGRKLDRGILGIKVLTADEIARRELEAKRQLEADGF